MFKPESFIIQILLSYVDKYIKNFKPEDSQLSLWGGEVSFQNLDLRLEVLEEELQLPFSFLSGHIHELIIHVPWTKLTSEPICITINTIECILKLRGDDAGSVDVPGTGSLRRESRKRQANSSDVVAPPGYIQTLVNKIVSNITINCCNLIVKYVEEDIVMSMNVKNLTFKSANDKWEPEFSDILSYQLTSYKIITLSDVTLCLDKRNASGKIDIYQEPVLYRCSLTMRLLRRYSSITAQRPISTRLDIHCHKMAFSISEIQVPMMMRLVLLARALHSREVGQHAKPSDSDVPDGEEGDDTFEESSDQESWVGWAWNLVASGPPLLSAGWFEDWTEDSQSHKVRSFHWGFYIDELAFNLRVGESSASEYTNWKSKLEPCLTLTLKGCLLDSVTCGNTWFNARLGICSVELSPAGKCCCNVIHSPMDSSEKSLYLVSGSLQESYYSDSLFSELAVKNLGKEQEYNMSWDRHLEHITESNLLEKTPALAIDYIYSVDLPEDFDQEKILEYNGDLEYSNLAEKSLCRFVVGPSTLRVSSSFLHRISRLRQAASLYDYQPYACPLPEEKRENLPTVTTEEYDSLEENIPLRMYQLTIFQPSFEFHFADHSNTLALLSKKKLPVHQFDQTVSKFGLLCTIDCQCIFVSLMTPMYPRRLVRTCCLLPTLPENMFLSCHSITTARILGTHCGLTLGSNYHHPIAQVSNITVKQKRLLSPHLWNDPDLLHLDDRLDVEGVQVTANIAQVSLVRAIVISLRDESTTVDKILCASLLKDTLSSNDLAVIEVSSKGIVWHKVLTSETRCDNMTVKKVEAFISNGQMQSTEHGGAFKSVLFSGPDPMQKQLDDSVPFFWMCLQWPRETANLVHAPLLTVVVQEAHFNLDPLLYTWILYHPVFVQNNSSSDAGINIPRMVQRKISSNSLSQDRTRRSQTPLSVHSSERDRDPPTSYSTKTSSDLDQVQDWKYMTWLVNWYPVWHKLILNVEWARWRVSLTEKSIAASSIPSVLGGVEYPAGLLCIDLPEMHLSSANLPHRQFLQQFFSVTKLPVKVPSNTWEDAVTNFPWNIRLSDWCAWTVINGNKQFLLRPVSTKCTIGITTRFSTQDKARLTSLGLCIHNDTGPLHITLNQTQAKLLSATLLGLIVIAKTIAENQSTASTSSLAVDPPSPSTTSESASIGVNENRNVEKSSDAVEGEDVKFNAWLQWTLTRMSVSLYQKSDQCSKLVMEVEDLMTALDLQQIYSKLKFKIAGANVKHFLRDSHEVDWQLAPYNGLVMSGHEEITPVAPGQAPSDEGCGLLTVTLTRAKCRNVHSRWGASVSSGSKRFSDKVDSAESCFITEVLVKLQPLDILFSMESLSRWKSMVEPFIQLLEMSSESNAASNSAAAQSSYSPKISSPSLPLMYLDLQTIRIYLPISNNFRGIHDTYIVQIESITLSPHAENPLSRTPLRPDVFHMAEQARILSIPGSEVEDRQYELNVIGLTMSTGQWHEMDKCRRLSAASVASSLRTMSENPALLWNSISQSTQSDGPEIMTPQVVGPQGSVPQPHLITVLSPMKISVVAAPAILYRKKIVVCGHALEVNVVSDIEVTITASQLSLAAALVSEMKTIWQDLLQKSASMKPCISSFVSDLVSRRKQRLIESDRFQGEPFVFDSGIDMGDVSSGDVPQSSRQRGERRISRTLKYVENVHGTAMHSLPTTHSTTRRRERDTTSNQSRPPTEYATDLLTNSRSSQKDRLATSGELISSKDRFNAPLDFLITGRKISLMFYDDTASTRECQVTNDEFYKNASPLLYVLVHQPHVFFSLVSRSSNMQISVYDIFIKLGLSKIDTDVPSLNDLDFPSALFETRKGEPDSRTGVLPTLFTMNCSFTQTKPAQISIDCGRPAKVICSTLNLTRLENVVSVSKSCLISLMKEPVSLEPSWNKTESGTEKIKDFLANVSRVTLKTSQLLFAAQAKDDQHVESEAQLSVSSLFGELECMSRIRWGSAVATVERVACNIDCNGLALSTSYHRQQSLILKPSVLNLSLELLWPGWLPKTLTSTLPHTQLSVHSDCVCVDLSPIHTRSLSHLVSTFLPMFQVFESAEAVERKDVSSPASEDCSSEAGTDSADAEQHYTDDLRAGAFQFMDSSDTMERDELPLPYQCVFWETSPPAMAWRYPQPRRLTSVQIFPVPFKNAPDEEVGREEAPVVVCSLQYWSECRGSYQPYATFLLSETSGSHLDLPPVAGTAVSAAWRVMLAGTQDLRDSHSTTRTDRGTPSSITDSPLVSPRALAACMKVDSFFSASLVPTFQAALNITLFQICLVNQLSATSSRSLPSPLEDYALDDSMPDTHSFLWLSLNHAALFSSLWPDGSKIIEISSLLRCEVLDYCTLTQQNVIEPFLFRTSVNIGPDDALSVSLVSKSIALRFSPSTSHTLAVSAQLWQQEWLQEDPTLPQVLIYQYLICNDTVFPLRIGQSGTEEDFPLLCRQCHMYAWRSLTQFTKLHISLLDHSMLSAGKRFWSTPFSIDECGTKVCKINLGKSKDVILFVKVTALSSTQKQVTISGQLVVKNELDMALDMRVVRPPAEWSIEACGSVLNLAPGLTSPSIVLDRPVPETQLGIRLRLQDNNLWTGDIPLKENSKIQQPWMVKVPMQEKGHFMSVWCRVIRQNIDGHFKILVLVSPLFAIRSFLPHSLNATVTRRGYQDTEQEINLKITGRGQTDLITIPGALIDYVYDVDLFTGSGEFKQRCASIPHGYVYGDPKQLFRTPDTTDIDAILSSLSEKKKATWPLPTDEFGDLQGVEILESKTHTQASYEPFSPYNSTLVLNLQPWALVINLLDSPVSINHAGAKLVTIPPRGVLAPPKLEGTFQLCIKSFTEDEWHLSEALQFTRAEWGKSFYMPRISGLIPIDGHIRINVNCGNTISLLTVASQVHNDIRVVTLRPTFILNNSSDISLRVTAFALRHTDNNKRISIPESDSSQIRSSTFTVKPNINNRGHPVNNWLNLKHCEGEIVPFIAISTTDEGPLSCPLRLTGCIPRRRFTVTLKDPTSNDANKTKLVTHSLVMCVAESEGQTFITIANEPHPQIVLHNKCEFRILCAQGCPVRRGNSTECKPVAEAAPWEYIFGVDAHCAAEYNLMATDELFPQIPTPSPNPIFMLAVDNAPISAVTWSAGIYLTANHELYVSLPGHGDVKVRFFMECHTTHVYVESVSRIEICAKDIRSRLLAFRSSVPNITDTYLDSSTEVSSAPEALDVIDSPARSARSSKDDSHLTSKQASDGCFISVSAFINSCSVSLTVNPSPSEERELATLTLDHIGISAQPVTSIDPVLNIREMTTKITVGDFQFDNHLFELGGYDFPVVLIGQQDGGYSKAAHPWNIHMSANKLIDQLAPHALLAVVLTLDHSRSGFVPKALHVSVGPLTAYVEDTFITHLNKHVSSILSPYIATLQQNKKPHDAIPPFGESAWFPIPPAVLWEFQAVAHPLRLTSLTLDPIWLLLSVHSCMKLYIALDRSPLQFTQFTRRSVFTSSYNLGHSLTMHYLSGAIFGAGWVVGSWELLGSPGGFARTLGTGLKDFVSLPYYGILQGPWGFLVGVTHGSASLMKHFTAGTLNSVTKMASSVARNLDRLTLDSEHLERTEELRRVRPSGVTQGLLQGLTGLGISLLGAVGGLAHHPLQSLLSGTPTPRDVVTGMGRGLVGVFTKPLSGAADLVAMTGQGLLQGAGWTNLPQLRQLARTERASSRRIAPVKYSSKIQRNCSPACLLVLEASRESSSTLYEAVTLVLTTQSLTILSADCDTVETVLPLSELSSPELDADPIIFTISFNKNPNQIEHRVWEFINGCQNVSNLGPPALELIADNRPTTPPPAPLSSTLPLTLQTLERQSAAEVEDVNPNLNLSQSSSEDGVCSAQNAETAQSVTVRPPLTFHINPQIRGHLIAAFKMAQNQLQERGFPTLS